MAKKPDTPCSTCGTLLWSGPRSRPAAERLCKDCRARPPEPKPPSPAQADEPADTLGPRAARLWRDVTAEATLTPVELVLLEEACRITDRCDRVDSFLRGHADSWMKFHARVDDGSVVEVVIDKALAESRQQALALKALVAELRASRGKVAEPKPEASRRDELARRREERRKAQGL